MVLHDKLTLLALMIGFGACVALLGVQALLGFGCMGQEELDYRNIRVDESVRANVVTVNEYGEFWPELFLYFGMSVVTGFATLFYVNDRVSFER